MNIFLRLKTTRRRNLFYIKIYSIDVFLKKAINSIQTKHKQNISQQAYFTFTTKEKNYSKFHPCYLRNET